ncbi:MAG: molybdenum cofactor biosynthesis protein MoaE [Acidimicrobiales bacterium]|nr:molybdenum cofactor biosynthesis protein MoaE [Acidimicrobiales bacterium]
MADFKSLDEDSWIEITHESLDQREVYDWLNIPTSGAVLVFSGNVRNHSEGREDVGSVSYEAHLGQVGPRLHAVEKHCRKDFVGIDRIALLHRLGTLQIGESSVVVGISAAHRDVAYLASRWCIDTIKKSVPIWKYEHFLDGGEWGSNAHQFVDLDSDDRGTFPS